MRTLALSALLVCAASFAALAPTASAIACTQPPLPHQCAGQTYECDVYASGAFVDECENVPPAPSVGVCVSGDQAVGTACTVDAPHPRNDGVCVGDWQVTGIPQGCEVTTWPAFGFKRCGGNVYALHVGQAQGPCEWVLP